jgi:hypothetical protein
MNVCSRTVPDCLTTRNGITSILVAVIMTGCSILQTPPLTGDDEMVAKPEQDPIGSSRLLKPSTKILSSILPVPTDWGSTS